MLLALLVAADWVTLLPQLAPAVPRVEIQRSDKVGVCSAAVVERTGETAFAIIAAHCVPADSTWDVVVNDKHATVVHRNALLELAILKFRATTEEALVIAATAPPMGTHVAILGYPFSSSELGMQAGFINQPRNPETKLTWVNMDVYFGNSGCPLVNEHGELVGIATGVKFEGPAHVGMVIPVSRILDYLAEFRASMRL